MYLQPVCVYTHPIKKRGEEKKGQQVIPPKNHQSKQSPSKISPAIHGEGTDGVVKDETEDDFEQQTYPSPLECLSHVKGLVHPLFD